MATALGVLDPPRTTGELAEALLAYRPELRATRESREAARFILRHPPLPWAARLPYAALAANAVATLPPWASQALGLRRLPGAERIWVRPVGQTVTKTIRWAMTPPPAGRRAA